MCEEGCRKSILVEHLHGSTDPTCKVKLMKMSKGFQWEISMSGDDFPTVVKKIDETNEIMKQKYGAEVYNRLLGGWRFLPPEGVV